MTLSRQNQKRFNNWMLMLYLLLFVSTFFTFRVLTNISIALLIASGIILNRLETGSWLNKRTVNMFMISCLLFYLLQFAGLLYTHDPAQQWKSLRIMSSLIFVPLAVSCCDFVNSKSRRSLLIGYCLLLFAAALYCLISNLIAYAIHRHADVFFYHQLVAPVSQHAIQFSIYIFIALLFLFEEWNRDRFVLNKYTHVLLTIFFLLFLILLSSKLVLGFFILYLLYFFISFSRGKSNSKWVVPVAVAMFVSFIGILFFIQNPVSKRFNEIIKGDVSLISEEKFTPGDYFNGLQFRLLQWRLVSEILTENNAWIPGVSAGEAQQRLDQKYISENMYTGEAFRHDRGFLGYNTHNQLLESLLQSGIIGAVVFLVICFSLIKIAWTRKTRLISFAVIMILLYSFSESVFETQYSLLIFTFSPLFLSHEP